VMNLRIWVQQSQKTKLWIETYGLWIERVNAFVEFFSGWRALVQKNRGFCEIWGFGGFLESLEWFRTKL
jgi:hypothetical protein